MLSAEQLIISELQPANVSSHKLFEKQSNFEIARLLTRFFQTVDTVYLTGGVTMETYESFWNVDHTLLCFFFKNPQENHKKTCFI